jgi:hypothetical protein
MMRRFFSLERFGITACLLTVGAFATLPGVSSTFADDTNASASPRQSPGSMGIFGVAGLTGVRNNSDLAQETGVDSNRKLGWGGGIQFDAPLAKDLSLGVGGIYIERKFQIGNTANRLERKVPTILVPVEAKFWFGNVLSIGAGGFGAVKVGNATDTAIAGTGSLQSNSASDHQTVEYGLTASVDVLLPASERTGIILGAQYFRGLNNGSKSPLYDEKIDDILFKAGLNFSL